MSSYFSLIPSGIMQNQKISDSSKITYALILGLSNRYGYCYASNSYLSEQRGLSESGIKRHLSELKDNNCITLEYNEKNDRRISPIIYPAVREKQLQASKNKQFGRYDIDEVSQALDTLWKRMK